MGSQVLVERIEVRNHFKWIGLLLDASGQKAAFLKKVCNFNVAYGLVFEVGLCMGTRKLLEKSQGSSSYL